MRRRAAAVAGAVVAAALSAVPACSSGTGSERMAPSSTTAEREWGSAPSTTAAPDPIPWTDVVAAVSVASGRLDRTDELVFPDGDNRLGGTGAVREEVLFDADRRLVQRTRAEPVDEAGTLARTERVLGPEGSFVSGDWVRDRCGVGSVREDVAVVPEALVPPNPLAIVPQVPTPDPDEVTETATTYAVELPTDLVVPFSFIDARPDVAGALDHQMTPVDVTIDRSGAVTLVAQIPLAVLADAGADIGRFGTIAPSAASQTTWVLAAPGEPVDIAVPGDAGSDASCLEG